MRRPTTLSKRSAPETEFRNEVGSVVGRLGRALGGIIRELPTPPRHAADLRRALDIDTKLSTQIFRIAKAVKADPSTVAFHVPGPPSMNRFLASSERAGVAEPAMRAVAEAYDEFLALVNRVAGDRVTFDSMAADITATGGGEQGDFLSDQHRKTAFRAMSHLLGVQAHTLYRCSILHRTGDDPYDFAQLRVYRQVRRLSASAPITLYRNRTGRHSGTPLLEQFNREPIDPALPHENGANLFPEFSSVPLSQVRVVQGERGSYYINLLGTSVGNSGAADLAFGHVDRRLVDAFVPNPRASGGVSAAAASTGIYFPIGRLVCDLIVPEGLFDPTSAAAGVYSNVYELELNPQSEWQMLPLNPKVTRPARIADITEGDYPAYAGVVRSALTKLGWQDSAFEYYRLVLEYPVLFSSVHLVLHRR